MEPLFDRFSLMHKQILQALEQGLGLPDSRIQSLCTRDEAELRLTHYPPIEVSRLKEGKTTRIAEHTDFGTVTLLFQDSTGGLEVEDQQEEGRFLPVESARTTDMIVNIGDTLQRWTNDKLRSVNHRVTIPAEMKDLETGWIPARYSIAYFGKPNRDVSMRHFAEFSGDGCSRNAEDITAWEYNFKMVHKTY